MRIWDLFQGGDPAAAPLGRFGTGLRTATLADLFIRGAPWIIRGSFMWFGSNLAGAGNTTNEWLVYTSRKTESARGGAARYNRKRVENEPLVTTLFQSPDEWDGWCRLLLAVALADLQRWSVVSDKKFVVIRPEKIEVRPRLRFERMISSNSFNFGSLVLAGARSRSLINSLNPKIIEN